MSDAHDEAPQTYDGNLEIGGVTADENEQAIVVGVHLSGFFQPIDGTFRWHGRIDPDERISALASRVGRSEIAVRVPGGEPATAKLGEVNPWGGYRIAGRGRPPFTVDAVEVAGSLSTDPDTHGGP